MPRAGSTIVPSGVAARRNFLINGGFDFWQRLLVQTTSGNVYLADRWRMDNTQANTSSRQFIDGRPDKSTYYHRTVFALNGAFQYFQALEEFDVDELKGRQVTVSFLVRRSSSFVGTFSLRLQKNGTSNTSIGGTWNTIDTLTIANADIPVRTPASTDWVRFSKSVTIPNDGTANGFRVNFVTDSLQPSGAIIEIAQVMLNIGPTPLPFERAGKTFGGELHLCKRFYWKTYEIDTNPGTATFVGTLSDAADANGTSRHLRTIYYVPEMRVAPTITGYNPFTGPASATPFVNGAGGSPTGISVYGNSHRSFNAHINGATGAGQTMYCHLTFDSEI